MYLVFIHCILHLPKSYYNLLYKKKLKNLILLNIKVTLEKKYFFQIKSKT
jgi:hypothetical protein